jgi:transcriptional regulator with XRE-family HTH domain
MLVAARRSPTIQRHRLGTELRRLREQAGRTIEEAADALECSDSKVSRIETGQVRVTLRDVRELLDLYGVGGRRREAIIEVAEKARVRAWWQAYGDAPGIPMVGLQAAAAAIQTYEAQLVPGLLQTADYARTVIEAIAPDLDSEQVRRRVELRMERQARLAEDNPPDLTAVLDEAALQRTIGTAEIMGKQLLHLAGAAELSTVTLQVLPLDKGQHAGLSGSFTIFKLPEPDPAVVFLEQLTRDLYLDTDTELRRYTAAFERLCHLALDPHESVKRIRDLAGNLAGER